MRGYDLTIILGAQITKQGPKYVLAPHTKLRAMAAGIAWQKGITEKFLISGGHNFVVRYDQEKILTPPNWSFEAFVLGRKEKSEAEIIKSFLMFHYRVPEEVIFLEEASAYTEESAQILAVVLRREAFAKMTDIALLTLFKHMKKALSFFHQEGLIVKPLFAERLLATVPEGRMAMLNYYSKKKDLTQVQSIFEKITRQEEALAA